jgi:hypothetical protein
MNSIGVVVGDIVADILRERDAQLEEPRREWREDTYDAGELARVAASLALHAAAAALPEGNANREVMTSRAVLVWPSYISALMPPGRRAMLVSACAFLVAEIARLDRLRDALPATPVPKPDEAAGASG